MSVKKYCPECGGELNYDASVKLYTCKRCGRTYTSEQLIETRKKIQSSLTEDDEVKKKRRDLLKWWLTEKK